MHKEIKHTASSSSDDPTAESRKQDHIQLAFQSQVQADALDSRFDYEPLLEGHPLPGSFPALPFLGKTMNYPIWISSMTGGTRMAGTINKNLAKACGEFGLGMGLGSCRSLLFDDTYFSDFDVRQYMGDQPLYANLGIAQLEQLISNQQLNLVTEMVKKLQADGLIIHVNPLQEAMQPEGDFFQHPPLQTIEQVLDNTGLKIIVKEVGQGMGPRSLEALLRLPLEAIDFAASGGTNFALLELLRASESKLEAFSPMAMVGHSAAEMVKTTNYLLEALGPSVNCKQLIISGGIKNFLDGFYLTQISRLPALYGKASSFLKHAQGDYESLQAYVHTQVRGLELAKAFLRIRT